MFNWFSKKQPAQPTEFAHILDFAKQLAAKNPQALIDLIRVLLRPLQGELLLNSIMHELHGAREEVDRTGFFMGRGSRVDQSGFNGRTLDKTDFLVHLNRDPILPCPWHRTRYVDTLSYIGKGKKLGDWEEDSKNHNVTIWLPWGVVFVNGGNHSIAAGIVGGEGTLKPTEVIDMGMLLDVARCDGKHYLSVVDGSVLGVVRNVKIAAIFEIGRLMREHRVVPLLRVNEVNSAKRL